MLQSLVISHVCDACSTAWCSVAIAVNGRPFARYRVTWPICFINWSKSVISFITYALKPLLLPGFCMAINKLNGALCYALAIGAFQ